MSTEAMKTQSSVEPGAAALDGALARQLWDLSESLAGVTFP